MRYGFVVPFAPPRAMPNLAREAEEAGWDGFFVWEPVWGVEAWVILGAAAMVTTRIRLGTMLTPITRMRPWKLAGETATVDHLSGGRVIVSVGLGAIDSGFFNFGEETDRKLRAERTDEGLDILTGLWRGQPFEYAGKHYQVQPTTFPPPPPPVQQPNIPIWVVGVFGSEKSLARVMRYNGLLPSTIETDAAGNKKARQSTPNELLEMTAYIKANRQATGPFDIVVEGDTTGLSQAQAWDQIRPWQTAGATWWLEAPWTTVSNDEEALQRIRQGPPKQP
jgi:alkanesulfonate monooxygenase SsuD/methylene tetrahydromethanopterin reductase-like flavin-dependent oxidoreductase (luciferase family)